MDIKKLQAVVIDALEDVKAQDIKLFDTTHLTSLFERIVIASGTSNRQTKALAASVRDKVKEAGGIVIGMEGGDTGEWVLVDLGDMLVHIMQAPIRAYYRLEEIWGDKEIKLGAAKRIANKPAAGEAGEPKKVSRHLASMQTPSEIPAIKEVKETKPRAKKADASADAPKRSRKKAEAQAVLETSPLRNHARVKLRSLNRSKWSMTAQATHPSKSRALAKQPVTRQPLPYQQASASKSPPRKWWKQS